MSRSKRRNRCNPNFAFWQSAGANQIRYQTFLNQILNIALSRFQWSNLPKTCDERYIERQLLLNGMVSIAMNRGDNQVYSLQVSGNGPINMYDNPSSWRALGTNGFTYQADWRYGAIAYDNLNRTPMFDGLRMYAYELADLMALKALNRQQQKAPFLLIGPESKKMDMVNIYKQIAGNEPAVLANADIRNIDIQAIQTGVSYIAKDVDEDIENTWRKVYGLLGINNSPYKAERQIESEVVEHNEPAEISRLSPLVCRRKAADWVNDVLGTDIQVDWRRDWDGKEQLAEFQELYGSGDDAM